MMKKINSTLISFFIAGFLFAQQAGAGNISVLDYGAVPNDTAKLSTVAINSAIDACFKNGGGKVIIPSGSFKSGTIVLKDNVELYFEHGSVLYASTDPNDFPRQQQPAYRSQKDKGGWFALIYAEGASNIAICGSGTINGQGSKQVPRPELFGGDLDGRPRNILLISCKNVKVEGLTMLHSGIWNQHYLNCEDVFVNGIKVFNHSNRNNDGIDIDGCRRVILSNSIIDSDDDGIVLKSTGTAACEDIAINNCIVSSHTNAIKCGTESTGGFRNIVISNCIVRPSANKTEPVFRTPRHGYTGISLEIVDGGIMEGVNVNNVVIEGTECPVYVRLGNRARKHIEEAPAPPSGKMRNIRLSNITAYNTGNYTSSITGVPGAKIENIFLDHITVVNRGGLNEGDFIPSFKEVKEEEKSYPQPNVWGNLPAGGFFIRHVKEIKIADATFRSIGPDPRIPVIAVDVDQLTVESLKTMKTATRPDLLLNDVDQIQKDDHLTIKRIL